MSVDHDLVQLALDKRWLEFPVYGQVPASWATDLVNGALRDRGVKESRRRREVLYDMYAQLLQVLRDEAREVEHHLEADDQPGLRLLSAYVYCPTDSLVYAADARLYAIELPPGQETLDAAIGHFVLPEQARFGPAAVSELDTASGTCARVAQLALDAQTGGDSGVASVVSYLWPTARAGVFLLLTARFGTPVEGAAHEATLDELARSLTTGAAL